MRYVFDNVIEGEVVHSHTPKSKQKLLGSGVAPSTPHVEPSAPPPAPKVGSRWKTAGKGAAAVAGVAALGYMGHKAYLNRKAKGTSHG